MKSAVTAFTTAILCLFVTCATPLALADGPSADTPPAAGHVILAQDDDDDSSQQTNRMLLDGLRKIGDSARCMSNCNARLSSCTMRCRSYRNNDPRGVACVMDCNADYNQCTGDCNQ